MCPDVCPNFLWAAVLSDTHPPNLFCRISSGGNDIWPTDSEQGSPSEVVMARRQKSERPWMWISLKGCRSARAPRLLAAACLARIHHLSPHIVTTGLPFQVPKRDVNQTHLLLLLWLCAGQTAWPSGCKVAGRQESSIHSVKCQSEAKK